MSRRPSRKELLPGADNHELIYDGTAAGDPALKLIQSVTGSRWERPAPRSQTPQELKRWKRAVLNSSVAEWWGHEVAEAIMRGDDGFFERLAEYVREWKMLAAETGETDPDWPAADPLAAAINSAYLWMTRVLKLTPTRAKLYRLLMERAEFSRHDKDSFRRQVDDVAKKLGLKFEGKRGRPRKSET